MKEEPAAAAAAGCRFAGADVVLYALRRWSAYLGAPYDSVRPYYELRAENRGCGAAQLRIKTTRRDESPTYEEERDTSFEKQVSAEGKKRHARTHCVATHRRQPFFFFIASCGQRDTHHAVVSSRQLRTTGDKTATGTTRKLRRLQFSGLLR
ncbi:hypothetical protein MRX96_012991 [Rhipicephalus microplus]